MRPVTLHVGGIKDPQVVEALREIERASNDTLQNDPSSSGSAMATLVGATLGSGGPELAYFLSQYTTAYLPLSINGIAPSPLFRIRLGAATTIYVDGTNGNDSNSGLAPGVGNALKTIQAAINLVANNYDLNGFNVTIQVANGTYTAGGQVNAPWVGTGIVLIQGDIVTPANVIVSTAGNCFVLGASGTLTGFTGYAGCRLQLAGLKLVSAGGTSIVANNQSYIALAGNMEFGAALTGHISLARGSVFQTLPACAGYTISGGAATHLTMNQSCMINYAVAVTITLTGTPAFSSAFVNIIRCSTWSTGGGVTFSGSATGVRYSVSLNGVLDTGGGGANFFPGNSAGSSATGGQYT